MARFLWVDLQLQTICAQSSDYSIRKALQDLPKSLPETFSRILNDARQYGPTHQIRLLKILVAALRPLTTEEIREAMSVSYLDTRWDASKLINNVHAVLACCGSLLFIDEEEETVHFIHHSVNQFLLNDAGAGSGFEISQDTADLEMAYTVLTYLNYNCFNTDITIGTSGLSMKHAPEKVIASTLTHGTASRSLALQILRRKSKPNIDAGPLFAAYSSRFQKHYTFHFHKYAKESFEEHSRALETGSEPLMPLMRRLLDKRPLMTPTKNMIRLHNIWNEACLRANNAAIPWTLENSLQIYGHLFWGLSNGHLVCFRSQLRHPRTGILSICRLVSSFRHKSFSVLSRSMKNSPRLLLRLLWLAVTFNVRLASSLILQLLRTQLSWDQIHDETSLLDPYHAAIPLIVKAKSSEPVYLHRPSTPYPHAHP